MNHRWRKDFFCPSLVSLVTLCLFRFHTDSGLVSDLFLARGSSYHSLFCVFIHFDSI